MDWLNDEDLNRQGSPPTGPADSPAVRPERPRRFGPLVAIALLLVVVVAAALLPRFWSTSTLAAATTAPTVAPSGVPVTAPPGSAAPTGSEPDEPDYLPPEDQRKLLDVGEAAMRAFARPSAKVHAKTWFAKLLPYLTAEAAEAYETTDPRNVPFTRLTHTPTMGPVVDEAELTRAVDVATDAGAYRVWISMLDYKVETFQPLED